MTYNPGPEFLHNSIKVKPDLDGLGALGDIGWYCVRAILWAVDFHLPKSVVAFPGAVLNDAGVILSCAAALHWDHPADVSASFHCSFLSHLSFDLTALGTRGSLRLHDLLVPFEENLGYATFAEASAVDFERMVAEERRWCPEAREERVESEMRQEVLMVKRFAEMVDEVRGGGRPEKEWGVMSRKTQVVVDAVTESIRRGYHIVEIQG